MKKQQKKSKKNKNKFKEFMHTLKPILIFSFIINLILLSYIYYLTNTQHTYIFAGTDDYLNIKSGVINMNYKLNLLEGNKIEYIYKDDYKIKELRIGYYVKKDDNLKEIISYNEEYEDSVSLKETINNLNTLNAWENGKSNNLFNKEIKKNIETNLYIILEAKTKDNENIVDQLQLEVSKLN